MVVRAFVPSACDRGGAGVLAALAPWSGNVGTD